MNSEVISKKRAARIERKKSRLAAIFNLQSQVLRTNIEASEVSYFWSSFFSLQGEGKTDTMKAPESSESEPTRPRLSDEEYKLLLEKFKARKNAYKVWKIL